VTTYYVLHGKKLEDQYSIEVCEYSKMTILTAYSRVLHTTQYKINLKQNQ